MNVVKIAKNNIDYKMLYMTTVTVVAGILSVVLFFTLLALNASNKLLDKWKLLKPGTNLELVMERLGPKLIDDLTDVREDIRIDYMQMRGSIKDPAFLQGKKLFIFGVSTPPCRALEVYTDENNKILFVTWQQL